MFSIWLLLLIICIAGGIGGLVNALVINNGFLLPNTDQKQHLFKLGFLSNILIGMVSAAVSWGLYGPLSAVSLFAPLPGGSFTLSTLVGAVLVGAGGARWLSSEVDKKQLTLQAQQAVTTVSTPSLQSGEHAPVAALTLNGERSP